MLEDRATAPPSESTPRPRRWLQFRLRSLFVIVTVAAVIFALLRVIPASERREVAGLVWSMFWVCVLFYAVIKGVERLGSSE